MKLKLVIMGEDSILRCPTSSEIENGLHGLVLRGTLSLSDIMSDLLNIDRLRGV